jgi:hypothetical protein
MSIKETTIANCPAYVLSDVKPGEVVDCDIFFSGRDEMGNQKNGKAEGLAAIKRHGQPKFFNLTWPKRIVVAIQYPNLTFNAVLIDAIVKEVKALPNVGNLYATGLSQGAIYWGKYFSSDDGTRAKQFVGCFLMSGSSIATSKVSNFLHLKMILMSGSELLDKTVPPKNYETVYTTFKKAGVDITYTQLNEGHNDNVWNHFSPLLSPAIYKGFTTPVFTPPVVTPQTQDMNPEKIDGDYSFTKSLKTVLYTNKTAGAKMNLPKPEDAAGFTIEKFRNKYGQPLTFSEPLYYGNEDKLTTMSDPGTFCIEFDDVEKRYYVIHY